MKFTKKILQILMLTLSTQIFAGDIGSMANTINTSRISQTDLQSMLTSLDSTKNTGLIPAANKFSSGSFMEQVISKDNLANIKPVLDVSLSVLQMVAMYYIGQTIMMPAFGGLTGSINTLCKTKYAVNTCSNWAKYKIGATLFLKNIGSVGSKFAQFTALTMGMAYAQNKLNGEKEAQVS